jgi:hypothetical protein
LISGFQKTGAKGAMDFYGGGYDFAGECLFRVNG